jgi:hypothetical protein
MACRLSEFGARWRTDYPDMSFWVAERFNVKAGG